MPKQRLSKRVVDAAVGPSITWDTEVTGFGLKVTEGGHKSFIYKYRLVGNGQQRKPTIGNVGQLTCDQARDIAREWSARVRLGGDPARDRGSARTVVSVGELCDRYLEEHAKVRNKPKTVHGVRSVIESRIKPALGSRDVRDISRTDIMDLHHAMRATPYAANRCLALLSSIFAHAEACGLRDENSNPCRRVRKYPESSRERFLDAQEIDRLHKVLNEHEPGAPHLVALFRLLLATGARLNEIAGMRWDYIDVHAGLVRLPDSKTGRKSIHLTDPVQQILNRIPRDHANPYVIVGRRPGRHAVGVQKFWQRVRSQAGLDGVRIHDLRHTYASHALAQGLSLSVIGKILGHR